MDASPSGGSSAAARGAVLASVRAARQTCKLFDEAARLHMLHTATLTPESAKGSRASGDADGDADGVGGGGPDWARFPALRRLRLEGWWLVEGPSFGEDTYYDAEDLRMFFVRGPDGKPLGAAAVGALAAVTALDSSDSTLDAASLLLLTARLPALRELLVCEAAESFSLVGAAAGAPRLERLSAPGLAVDAAAAAAMARLPALRALTVHSICAGDAWDLLPCSRLTRLGVEQWHPDAPLPLSSLGPPRFPHLQELRGVPLSPEGVSALAHSAPRLRLLNCTLDEAAWRAAGARHGSLPAVTHACFKSYEHGVVPRAVDLARLLPHALNLVISVLPYGSVQIRPALGALTGLHTLMFIFGCEPLALAHPGDWAALARLTRLTRLACAVDSHDPAQLSSLARLTGLEVLVADLACLHDPAQRSPSIGALLEAAARLPRLHTLTALMDACEPDACEPEWDFGALARFTHAAPPLRHLTLWYTVPPPLAFLGAVAMHTRLQRLALPRPQAAVEIESAAAVAAQVSASCYRASLPPCWSPWAARSSRRSCSTCCRRPTMAELAAAATPAAPPPAARRWPRCAPRGRRASFLTRRRGTASCTRRRSPGRAPRAPSRASTAATAAAGRTGRAFPNSGRCG
ncbi:MAG: hypothetical protein J3K34DRAFT_141860 [Monoraphidium minutum]|nr:MAG: hypothetical protein J3K34DRAFT_141860 [Monoraphidium minutum]